jgi:hypothetical protein
MRPLSHRPAWAEPHGSPGSDHSGDRAGILHLPNLIGQGIVAKGGCGFRLEAHQADGLCFGALHGGIQLGVSECPIGLAEGEGIDPGANGAGGDLESDGSRLTLTS